MRLVSPRSELEQKIDRIENRLANIEHLLRHRSSVISSPSTTKTVNSPATLRDGSPDTQSIGTFSPVPTPVLAGTGVLVESAAAQDILEHTVRCDADAQQDLQLSSALQSLRFIVSRIHVETSGLACASSISETSLPTPDWETQIRPLLERIEGLVMALTG
ncbi:hypothetical protein ANO11243_084560 [Dothideomycetidae sp. 11243]|nr:hypothetical protein ANO11243_084560 [fungal sp. No.11243]